MNKVEETFFYPDQLVIGRKRFKRSAYDYSKAQVRKTRILSTHVTVSFSLVQEQIINIDIGGVDEKD